MTMEAENPKRQKTTTSAVLNGGSMAEQKEEELEFSEDAIFEILTWLPMKKMIQCRCLSKKWRSIIQSRDFRELYTLRIQKSGNPPCVGIIFSYADFNALNFMYAPLEDEKPREIDCDNQVVKSFALRFTAPFPEYKAVTKIINGLICLYNGNLVTLCNVCTGETFLLPPSPSHSNETSVSYHFGFDTINRVYKVLKLTILLEGERVADVLTLGGGDLRWRTLGVSVPILRGGSLYIAGKLYWTISADVVLGFNVHTFDLCMEQFDRVSTPTQQMVSGYYTDSFLCDCSPLIYNERLALACRNDFNLQMWDLWIPEDDTGSYWTSESIDFPVNSSRMLQVGVLPSGEILMMNFKGTGRTSADVYSYDCETRKFKQRFLVDNFPTKYVYNSDAVFRTFCVEENILPLDVVIRGGLRSNYCSTRICDGFSKKKKKNL